MMSSLKEFQERGGEVCLLDTGSTDNSVEVAKSLGCKVVSWSSGNIMNEIKQMELKNNCWKLAHGWVIMADMDEYVCVTEDELLQEMEIGTSILRIRGVDMIGESTTTDLSDIDLQTITKCRECPSESKSLCFFREHIKQMNYGVGAHTSKPVGKLKYSKVIYINKHMNFLGLNFYIDKVTKRYSRNEKMRRHGMNTHYTDDVEIAKNTYTTALKQSLIIHLFQ